MMKCPRIALRVPKYHTFNMGFHATLDLWVSPKGGHVLVRDVIQNRKGANRGVGAMLCGA